MLCFLLFICLANCGSVKLLSVLIHYFLFLFVFFLFSCNAVQEKNVSIMARVGNKKLTTKNIDSVYSSADIEKTLTPGLVLKWVDNTILYTEAEKAGFTKDKRLKEKRDSFYRDLVVSSYINNSAERSVRVTKDKIKSYYKENLSSFLRKEDEVFATHYTTKTGADAGALKKQLLSKSGPILLDTLRYAKETQSIKRGRLVKALDRPLFLANQNVVGPIKNKNRYHLFRVFNRYKKGSQKDLVSCYDEIYQRLHKRAIAEKSTHILDSLKQGVNIYINPEYQQQ